MKSNIKIWLLSAFIVLVGCTAQYHVQKASKQQQKAIKKGAILTNDVDTITIGDTITEITRIKDTVFITNTVTKVIIEKGEVRFVTRKDKRKERKDENRADRFSHKEKMRLLKQQGKSNRTEIRSKRSGRWFSWRLVIIVAVLAVYLFITNIFR